MKRIERFAEDGSGSMLRLSFRPFEVKTIKIRLGQDENGRRDR